MRAIIVLRRDSNNEPATVTENQTATILWDMPIQTDKEIKANRPDIVVKDRKEHLLENNGKTRKVPRS